MERSKRAYRIRMFETYETVLKKGTEEMKRWIAKYNVTDATGNKLNLATVGTNGKAIRANGKLLWVSR